LISYNRHDYIIYTVISSPHQIIPISLNNYLSLSDLSMIDKNKKGYVSYVYSENVKPFAAFGFLLWKKNYVKNVMFILWAEASFYWVEGRRDIRRLYWAKDPTEACKNTHFKCMKIGEDK
jgi:hypothetical protein